jgi:GNAT superfamily N-acetyltransferase
VTRGVRLPHRVPTLRTIRPGALVVVGLYAALTLVFTYPLAAHLTDRYVGEAAGDARIYVWNLWWVKTAIVRLHTDPLQTDFIFFPTGIGLALHTLALTHGLVFIPLSAIAGDVAAANLVVLATFLASALGAYALARHLGADRPGAFLAGVIFAFCPARLARLAGHYDLLSTEWIPLYALAFLKVLESPRFPTMAIVASGLLGAACGYTDLTYLVFLVFASAILLALAPRETSLAAVAPRAAFVAVLVAALLAPLLLEAWRDAASWRYPPYPGSDRFLADLMAYVTPGPRQTLLGPIAGRAFDANLTETTVFAGWTTLALGLGALLTRGLGRARIPWLVLGAAALVLSLGDTLHVGGRDTGLPLLFPWLRRLPALHHLRAPSRFSILVMLSLAVLVALAWTRWWRRSSTRVSLVASVAALGLVCAEFLAVPIPTFAAAVPPLYARLGREPGDFTIVEVPGIDQVPAQIMHHQTVHGKRIFIGTAARVPAEKTGYFFGLPLVRPLVDLRKERMTLADALDPQVTAPCPEAARFLGIRYLVVEKVYQGRGLVRFLEAALPTERVEGDDERLVLRVRPEALPPLPLRLEAGSPASRLYYESGWAPPEGGDVPMRRATRSRSTILFRRPFDGPLALDLALSGPVPLGVEGRFRGRSLGRATLPASTDVRWTLPSGSAEDVERIELLWSAPGGRIARVVLGRPGLRTAAR